MKSLRVISDGTALGTSLFDEHGDSVKLVVRSISFRHDAGKTPDITLQVACVTLDIDGKAAVEIMNPKTGNWQLVQSIKFVDGTEWNVDE
jgi:hypothetical protein